MDLTTGSSSAALPPIGGAPRPGLGFVKVKSPEQVTKQMDAEPDEGKTLEAPVIDLGAVRHSAIISQASFDWERAKAVRQQTDRRLLACMRMRLGEYSSEELQMIAQSGANNTIYMRIAATKARALAAWLKEILQTPGDRPIGITARPLPELPEAFRTEILKKAIANVQQHVQSMAQQQGSGSMPMDQQAFEHAVVDQHQQLEESVKADARRLAAKQASKMEDKIFQRMDEGNFDDALSEFIEFFSTYPTAVLKGPFVKSVPKPTWTGGWKMVVKRTPVLWWKAVHPMDLYPAALAKSCQERTFIERMRLAPSELWDMIGLEGYDEDAIRWAIASHEGGLLKNWIWTDAERARLESDTSYTWFTQGDLMDALHYWGSMQGSKLMQWGMQGLDPQRFYEMDAIIIGSRVIRCCLNPDPLGKRPYNHASFDEVPGAFWGKSPLELCESQQDMCNAAARSLCNNMGIASGPQVWVNIDRLPPNENIRQMFPWKIWQFNKDTTGSTGNAALPIGFFQPQSNAQELMAVFKEFDEAADDATGIPRYAYGDEHVGGAGSTYSGLQMLMGAAAKGIRRAVAAIDKMLRQTTHSVFIHEMVYGDDHDVKGDVDIEARGSAALLIKEQMQQGRQQLLGMLQQSPLIQKLVGMRGAGEVLREFLKGLHLPGIMPDGPEFDQMVEQMQQALMNPPPSPAQIMAKERLQAADMRDKSRERQVGAQVGKDLAIAKMRYPGKAAGALAVPGGNMSDQAPQGGPQGVPADPTQQDPADASAGPIGLAA